MNDQFPTSGHGRELELVTRVDVTEIVTGLVQLIEAKALAQRLAYKVLVRELTAVAGPKVAFLVQTSLDAVRCDPALLSQDDDSLQGTVTQELSLLIEELEDLVSDP